MTRILLYLVPDRSLKRTYLTMADRLHWSPTRGGRFYPCLDECSICGYLT